MAELIGKKPACRFDMFVRLKPELVARYPNNSLTWCYRGDKFTIVESEMLPCLLRMFLKRYAGWKIAMIRDNDYPATDKYQTVLKYCNGIIEINHLKFYSPMLTKIILPSWLK